MSKQRLRLLLPLLLLLVAIGQGVPAQDMARTAGKAITAARVLEQNLKATGGLEARQQLYTVEVRGDYGLAESSRSSGSFTFLYRRPIDDVLQFQGLDHETFSVGHHEGGAFAKQQGVPFQPKNTGSTMEILEQDLRSLLETDPSGNYDKIELIGRAEVNKRWAYGLRFTPKQGTQLVRFYDYETFLLVRMDQVQLVHRKKNDPGVPYVLKSYFRDYKDHGGVKLPHTVTLDEGNFNLQFKISVIQPNAKIDDSVFQ